MNVNFYKPKEKVSFRKLLTLDRISIEDILEVLYLTKKLKNLHTVNEKYPILKNKSLLLITKHSIIRTPLTFQLAVEELGGKPYIVAEEGEHLNTFISDDIYIRSVVTDNFSCVVMATEQKDDCLAIEKNTSIPIINATRLDSPVEAVANLFTVWEALGKLENVKITIVGDATKNNTFLRVALKLGAEITVVTKQDYPLAKYTEEYVKQFGNVTVTDDLVLGVKNADVVFMKNTASGNLGYKFDEDVLLKCRENVKIMSSIPANKDMIDYDILDGEKSLVTKQADNFLHTEKAMLALICSKK